ncbi:hypothetical protein [Streptomyces sp. NPDC047108]|uniref:hypothetical protein n=1 Tax=Streptomyces sp. NPDC047108 TaxID=3155025 RepID=UPI0033DE454A
MTRSPVGLATSAMVVLSLAALTGCGGGDGDGSATGSDDSSSVTKKLSPADDVAQRIVTQAEVKDYSVRKPDAKYVIAKNRKGLAVDKSTCVQAAYAMNGMPIGDPRASLTRDVGKKNTTGMSTKITLSTYADGKAEAAMAALARSVKSCGGPFIAKGSGGNNPYGSVKAEADPGYGDKSLAFAATYDANGAEQKFRTQAARFGDTVVVYFTLNSDALLSSLPGEAKIPMSVVKAQNAKLG